MQGASRPIILYQTYEGLKWMVFGVGAHAACYLKEDGEYIMHQGRSGTDDCEHFFNMICYINSNPTMHQAREGASKVSSQVGMYLQAFQSDNKGNSGTARSETTAAGLLKPVPTRKKRKK